MNDDVAAVAQLLERATESGIELVAGIAQGGLAQQSAGTRVGVHQQKIDDVRIVHFIGAVTRVTLKHQHFWRVVIRFPNQGNMHAHRMHHDQRAHFAVASRVSVGIGQVRNRAGWKNAQVIIGVCEHA